MFHVKSPFRSWDIYMFVFTCGYIQKLFGTIKLMASQTGQQIITINIFPNVYGSKCNQTIESAEYDMS